MFIDILIPSKNPDENLLKTVDSLSNIEEIKHIIIIDDSENPNNKTYKKIKKKHNKIILLKNYNPGISGALNTGIEFSNSKFLARIDSGDILDTNKFPITEFDTAETMHFKNTLSMCDLIKKNLNATD